MVKPKFRSPRTLFWDLETSLLPVAVFSLLHNDYINPDSILSERYIICGSYKWEDESKVHSVSVLDDPKRYKKDPHDDLYVVRTLHDIISSADVIIGHNSDVFDKRYLDTRILYHGLSALPPIASVDTYKVAKTRFSFNSNKLDYLGGYLKVGKKIHTSPGLWLRVLNGEASAVKEMVSYNRQDVILLEAVYQKLKPYASTHINYALFGVEGCPRCGSDHIQSRGTHKAISRVYRRYCCVDCGGWFRSMLNDKYIKVKTRIL